MKIKILLSIAASLLISLWLFNIHQQLIKVDYSELNYLKIGTSEIDRLIYIGLAMLLGIFTKSIISYFDNKEDTKAKHEFKGLIKALFISPFIFFGIYFITISQPDDLVSLLLSYQNGFFWRSVLT